MTTSPPESSEPSDPVEPGPGPDRPEPQTPQASQSPEKPADREGEEPAGPPSSPNQPADQYPEPGPQYPAPPPLPPEAYPGSGYGGGPGYEYGAYGAPPVRPRNGMGVAALVLGIVGFLIGPTSILAIVFGRIGLNRVARGEATNKGVAQAGFVLGIVTLALWILGLILLANRH